MFIYWSYRRTSLSWRIGWFLSNVSLSASSTPLLVFTIYIVFLCHCLNSDPRSKFFITSCPHDWMVIIVNIHPGQFITSEVAKVGNRRSLRVSVCGQVVMVMMVMMMMVVIMMMAFWMILVMVVKIISDRWKKKTKGSTIETKGSVSHFLPFA